MKPFQEFRNEAGYSAHLGRISSSLLSHVVLINHMALFGTWVPRRYSVVFENKILVFNLLGCWWTHMAVLFLLQVVTTWKCEHRSLPKAYPSMPLLAADAPVSGVRWWGAQLLARGLGLRHLTFYVWMLLFPCRVPGNSRVSLRRSHSLFPKRRLPPAVRNTSLQLVPQQRLQDPCLAPNHSLLCQAGVGTEGSHFLVSGWLWYVRHTFCLSEATPLQEIN